MSGNSKKLQTNSKGLTVYSYRDSLFEKPGVKTRVALALYAVKSWLHKL